MAFKVPECYRVTNGPRSTNNSYGNNGWFIVTSNDFPGIKFRCIASDIDNWELVSVSILGKERYPKWLEMCFIKTLFWSYEDVVVQLHTIEQFNNQHPYCLQLWRAYDSDKYITPPDLDHINRQNFFFGNIS